MQHWFIQNTFIMIEGAMIEVFTDEFYMRKAIELAKEAYEADEIPIGALVVSANKIIGKGYNQTEKLTDVTAHAEMLAITAASSFLNAKFLNDCTLYVTVEPCLMCAGAIKWARINRIVYGAREPKFGFSKTSIAIIDNVVQIENTEMQLHCAELMSAFFKAKR